MATTSTKIRSISQLPQASDINNDSLLLVSEVVDRVIDPEDGNSYNKYQSKSIKGSILKNGVTDAVFDTLAQFHGFRYDSDDPNSTGKNTQLGQMEQQLSAIVNGFENVPTCNSMVLKGKHVFEKHPIIQDSLADFSSANDDYSIKLEDLKNFENSGGGSLLINANATFTTQYNNVENNEYPSDIIEGIENAPSVEAEKHNVYIFKINGYTSNTWTCPANGMFTCYGWVDEKDNIDTSITIPASPKRWIALEGLFNDSGTQVWKILQLQPVIPNMFCSYVSFTFPVNAGMQLRLESGFNVGTNSNKYNSVNGSLTNHLANSFVGGVYSKSDWAYTSSRSFDTNREPSRLVVSTTKDGIAIKSSNDNALVGTIDKSELFAMLSSDFVNLMKTKTTNSKPKTTTRKTAKK